MPEASQSTAAIPPETSEFELAVLAHANHYALLLARLTPQFCGQAGPLPPAEQFGAGRGLSLELSNLLEALDSALRREDAEILLRMAQHLWYFLDRASHYRHFANSYRSLLALAEQLDSEELLLHTLLGTARIQWRQGSFDAARETAARLQELPLLRERPLQAAQVLGNLGLVEISVGNHTEASSLFEASLELMRAGASIQGEALVSYNLGNIAQSRGDPVLARRHFEHALETSTELGDRFLQAQIMNNLALVLLAQDERVAALELLHGSLGRKLELGDHRGAATSLGNLAALALEQGNLSEARRLSDQALELCRELGDPQAELSSLLGLLSLERAEGNLGQAAGICAGILTRAQALGHRPLVLAALTAAAAVLAAAGSPEAALQAAYSAERLAQELQVQLSSSALEELLAARVKASAMLAAAEAHEDFLLQAKSALAGLSLTELVSMTCRGLKQI